MSCAFVPLFKVTLGDVACALALRQMLSMFGAEQRRIMGAGLHLRFSGVGVQVVTARGTSADGTFKGWSIAAPALRCEHRISAVLG